MKFTIAAITLCFLLAYSSSYAQTGATDINSYRDLFSKPQLFDLNEQQENHHFHIKLPDDGILDIDFQRLSDWGARNHLNDLAAMANIQVQHLKDSFQHDYSSKLIAVNIPVAQDIISIRYEEDATQRNQLAYRNGSYYQLKSGFDTIRIIKNTGVRLKPGIDSGIVQIRYNFILKDLNDLDKLVQNPATLEHIGNELDAVIAEKRKKWKNEDADQYQLTLDYDKSREKPMEIISDKENATPFLNRKILLYSAFGAAIFKNSIAPFIEGTLAYRLPPLRKSERFIGLNYYYFPQFNSDFSLNRNYVALNLEYGIFGTQKRGSGFMQQKTSVAIGIMFDNFKKEEKLLNFALNYGVTRNFTISMGGGWNLKTYNSGNSRGIFYVNFKFNL